VTDEEARAVAAAVVADAAPAEVLEAASVLEALVALDAPEMAVPAVV